jgi:hypothetical protein
LIKDFGRANFGWEVKHFKEVNELPIPEQAPFFGNGPAMTVTVSTNDLIYTRAQTSRLGGTVYVNKDSTNLDDFTVGLSIGPFKDPLKRLFMTTVKQAAPKDPPNLSEDTLSSSRSIAIRIGLDKALGELKAELDSYWKKSEKKKK